jgi:hypothetical protein
LTSCSHTKHWKEQLKFCEEELSFCKPSHNHTNMLDSLADLMYDSDGDEELTQIQDQETRIKVKRDRLSRDFSKGFKQIAPTIATAIGFIFAQKCMF